MTTMISHLPFASKTTRSDNEEPVRGKGRNVDNVHATTIAHDAESISKHVSEFI